MLIRKLITNFSLLFFTIYLVTSVSAQPTKIYMVQGSATPAQDALVSADLDGTDVTVLASGAGNFGQPTKLVVDKAAGYIYVADGFTPPTGLGLIRYNLDGTGRTVIIPPVSGALINGVAINKAEGKLYFTTGSTTPALDALMSSDLDGTNIQTLASGATNFAQPADLQVDPVAGHIYVADMSTGGMGIQRFNLDGTGKTTIIPSVAGAGNIGLALDLVDSKIYFTQGSGTSSLDALKVANLDGTGITTLASDAGNFTQPADVYLDRTNGHLYISDAVNGGNLLRYDIDGTNRVVVVTGISGSLMTGVSLDDPLITLPVHLTSFSGRSDEYVHILEWEVENEENFSHYELELDKGEGFSSIATITAVNNHQYTYRLTVNSTGSFLYRLKMVDNDGSFTHSKSIRLDGKAPLVLQLFPNPSSDWITASINQPVEHIRIFNNNGQLVKMVRGFSNRVVGLSITGLSKGTYIVQVKTATQVHTKKLIVQ